MKMDFHDVNCFIDRNSSKFIESTIRNEITISLYFSGELYSILSVYIHENK